MEAQRLSYSQELSVGNGRAWVQLQAWDTTLPPLTNSWFPYLDLVKCLLQDSFSDDPHLLSAPVCCVLLQKLLPLCFVSSLITSNANGSVQLAGLHLLSHKDFYVSLLLASVHIIAAWHFYLLNLPVVSWGLSRKTSVPGFTQLPCSIQKYFIELTYRPILTHCFWPPNSRPNRNCCSGDLWFVFEIILAVGPLPLFYSFTIKLLSLVLAWVHGIFHFDLFLVMGSHDSFLKVHEAIHCYLILLPSLNLESAQVLFWGLHFFATTQ